jgi:hypothetical protein
VINVVLAGEFELIRGAVLELLHGPNFGIGNKWGALVDDLRTAGLTGTQNTSTSGNGSTVFSLPAQ